MASVDAGLSFETHSDRGPALWALQGPSHYLSPAQIVSVVACVRLRGWCAGDPVAERGVQRYTGGAGAGPSGCWCPPSQRIPAKAGYQLDRIRDFSVEFQLAREAHVLHSRLGGAPARGHASALRDATIEHCCALGGGKGSAVLALLAMDQLRACDLECLGDPESRAALLGIVEATLADWIPASEDAARDAAEAQGFAHDWLELLRARCLHTPRTAHGRLPVELVCGTTVPEAAAEGVFEYVGAQGGAAQLRRVLAQCARWREAELAAHLLRMGRMRAPRWWCVGTLLFLVAAAVLAPYAGADLVLGAGARALPALRGGAVRAAVKALLWLVQFAAVVHFCQGPRGAWGGPRALWRWHTAQDSVTVTLYRDLAEVVGFTSPLSLDLDGLERRCDAQLRAWERRRLASEIAAAVRRKRITGPALAALLLDLCDSAADRDCVELPCPVAVAEAFLEVSVDETAAAAAQEGDARAAPARAIPAMMDRAWGRVRDCPDLLEDGDSPSPSEADESDNEGMCPQTRPSPGHATASAGRSARRWMEDARKERRGKAAASPAPAAAAVAAPDPSPQRRRKALRKRNVADLIKEGGWTVVRRKRHMVLRRDVVRDGRPEAQTVSLAKTPGDHRHEKNIRALFRKMDENSDRVLPL